MKLFKSLVAVLLVSFLAAGPAMATSYSVTVLPNTMTNIMSFSPNQGALLVKQVIFTSGNNGPSSAAIIDTPTNSLTYTTAAYTNMVSYATNGLVVWTNYYGVVQSNNYVGGQLLTNWWLVDVTNSVAAATYNYPVRVYCAAATSATTIYGQVNGQLNGYYFDQGIWATNTSAGTNIITIVY